MYWDESNRLRVVNDNDHQIQHYIYDGAGERILKASSQIETVYENGQVDANTTTMGLYTTYVSPYMVVDANQKYSKHYFNGTQRVASKIGEQDITMFDTNNPYLKQANSKAAENTPSTDFDTLKNKQITDFSYYLSKSTNNATAKNVKVKYTEYKKVDTNTETTSAKAADNNSTFAAPQYAEIYYYHSDHLGTGTFLSDFDGNPYQFFLNLPFGETMAEQHSYSGEYTNRYKFNGKELDEETGFYYYGARYYNPKFSIWLSVDPLAEVTMHPYSAFNNNPIRYNDPTGMIAEDPSTHTDEQGNVIAVYNDGDNGVYKHGKNADGGTPTKYQIDKRHEKSTSGGGEKMGESLHSLSFADQSLYNKTGKVEAADIKIDFGSKNLTYKVQGIINSDPSLKEYISKAGKNGVWDIKSKVENGSLLFGKFASPRDAGNFAAGAIAQMSGLEPVVQFGYGAYNLTGNNKVLTGLLTVAVVNLSLAVPSVGIPAGYLIGKYGEDKLSQRSIDIGKNYIINK